MNVVPLHEAATILAERKESHGQVQTKLNIRKIAGRTAATIALCFNPLSCHPQRHEPTSKQSLQIMASDMPLFSITLSAQEKEAELTDAVECCIARCTVATLEPLISLAGKKDLQAQDVINAIARIQDPFIRKACICIIASIAENPDNISTLLNYLKSRADETVVSASSFTGIFKKRTSIVNGHPEMTITQIQFIKSLHPNISEYLKNGGKNFIYVLMKEVAQRCRLENISASSMAMKQ